MKTSKFFGIVTVMTVLGTSTMFGQNNSPRGDQQIQNQPRQEQRMDNKRESSQKNQHIEGKTFSMQPQYQEPRHTQPQRHVEPQPVPRHNGSDITTGLVVGTVVGTVLGTLLSK